MHQRTMILTVLCILGSTSFCRAELDEAQRGNLLKKFSPVFYWCDARNEESSICDPYEYLNDCQIVDGGKLLADGKRFSMQELYKALKENAEMPGGGHAFDVCERWEIKPHAGIRGGQVNEDKRGKGQGIFGHVTHLNGDEYSVKYMLFRSWNETAYDTGEGNHEGDWLCIDFQVMVHPGDLDENGFPSAEIEYGLFHNHGRILLVDPRMMQTISDKRPKVFLELGTNEPWAVPRHSRP